MTPTAHGDFYRLPLWEEVLDAKPHGFLDQKRNPFAFMLKGEAWLGEPFGAPASACHFLDFKDLSQTPTPDCKAPRRVICVAACASSGNPPTPTASTWA